MNTNRARVILVIIGAILFHLVFWSEKLAINTVIFDAFIVVSIYYLYPQARRSTTVSWLLAGQIVCLAMVVIHNTVLSKIAFTALLLLFVTFAEYRHRSVLFASGSFLLNLSFFVPSFVEDICASGFLGFRKTGIGRYLRLIFFPLALLLVFSVIYMLGNSVFESLAERVGEYISNFLASFSEIFWARLFFLIAGLYLTGSLLLATNNSLPKIEAGFTDDLHRNKSKSNGFLDDVVISIMGRFGSGMMALRNVHTIGVISLLLLNILLLVINFIDIRYLWFDFDYMGNVVLYKLVHEGTEILILSILLAIAVLLVFFKGNLNFYKKNKWLKYAAYAWIIQNCVLVFSVLIRDYYYIMRFGLAYKRIGVLMFLILVLTGLITVFIKIYSRKTTYFLLRVNAWAVVVLLVISSTVHWDEMIAGYNLSRKQTVPLDVPFLMTLSDKTLPLLDSNRSVLGEHVKELDARKNSFLAKQEKVSWLSWNYADSYTKSSINAH